MNATPLVRSRRELGMPLYSCQPPTGYSEQSDAWVNTGALLNRMNFAVALAIRGMRGIRTDAARGTASSAAAVLTAEALGGDVPSNDDGNRRESSGGAGGDGPAARIAGLSEEVNACSQGGSF